MDKAKEKGVHLLQQTHARGAIKSPQTNFIGYLLQTACSYYTQIGAGLQPKGAIFL